MMTALAGNLGTILVLVILVVIIGSVVYTLIRKKREGKTSCGCGCSSCPSAGICHRRAS